MLELGFGWCNACDQYGGPVGKLLCLAYCKMEDMVVGNVLLAPIEDQCGRPAMTGAREERTCHLFLDSVTAVNVIDQLGIIVTIVAMGTSSQWRPRTTMEKHPWTSHQLSQRMLIPLSQRTLIPDFVLAGPQGVTGSSGRIKRKTVVVETERSKRYLRQSHEE
jgi:hypothetical protein